MIDKIWLFYSLDTMLAYWRSDKPIYFNLDKYEKSIRKEKAHQSKGKRNKKGQDREDGGLLNF